jgi:hypothetical protein
MVDDLQRKDGNKTTKFGEASVGSGGSEEGVVVPLI